MLNVRFNNMIEHYFDKVESYSFAPALRKHHHINIFNNKRQPSKTLIRNLVLLFGGKYYNLNPLYLSCMLNTDCCICQSCNLIFR